MYLVITSNNNMDSFFSISILDTATETEEEKQRLDTQATPNHHRAENIE